MKLRLILLLGALAMGVTAVSGCDPASEDAQTDAVTTPADTTIKTDGYDESVANSQLEEQKPGAVPEGTISVADRKPKDGEEVAVLETGEGRIVLMFFPDKAPKHVENFKKLIKEGFYDGTKFHRTIPGFMIQGGDPNTKTSDRSSWGMGGPSTSVKAEFNDIHHAKGVLSMARSADPDSAGSQFFIMVDEYPSLNHQYSAFGKVVTGQEVADKIVAKPTDGDLAVDPVAIKKAIATPHRLNTIIVLNDVRPCINDFGLPLEAERAKIFLLQRDGFAECRDRWRRRPPPHGRRGDHSGEQHVDDDPHGCFLSVDGGVMKQPNAGVSGVRTGLPRSTASTASRRSCRVTTRRGLPKASYRLSMRPR